MSRKRLVVTAAIISVLVAGVGLCAWYRWQERHEALKRLYAAEEARRNLNLRGRLVVKTYFTGTEVEAEAEVARGQGRLHLRFLTGPVAGMQIIQEERQIWEIGRGGRVRRGHQLLAELPLFPPDALERDSIRRTGRGSVAGRSVTEYTIVPREHRSWRLVYQLDDETEFPLCIERYMDGRPVSKSRFVSVEYGVPPPPSWEPPKMPDVPAGRPPGPGMPPGPGQAPRPGGALGAWGAMAATEAQARDLLGTAPLRPSYLPEGFRELGMFIVPGGPRGPRLEIRYSDGMRVLVIVQRRATRQVEGKGDAPEDDSARIVRPYGWPMARVTVAGVRLTVLGPLPEDELIRIAQSAK